MIVKQCKQIHNTRGKAKTNSNIMTQFTVEPTFVNDVVWNRNKLATGP